MTDSDPSIPDASSQAEEGIREQRNGPQNGYSATDYSNNTGAGEWTNLKQSTFANTATNTANFTRISNNKGDTGLEGHNGAINYMDMQNNSYMKAGYPDARAYYGWLPAGLSPMRLPALIYPHSFLGFAPTVAWMKTNDNIAGQVTNIEKIDRWESNRKSGASSTTSEVSQTSTTYTDEIEYTSDKMKDTMRSSNSDDDEGLVLDEKETSKRRQQKEFNKQQTQMMKSQPERSSVIQENRSIQAKQSVIITHAEDATVSSDQEHSKPSKRGRASTRQIEKTEQYWDRRKKNNVSAKKSRDARRQRESLMNHRSGMLETENLRLRAELATLREENARLKQDMNSLKNTQS